LFTGFSILLAFVGWWLLFMAFLGLIDWGICWIRRWWALRNLRRACRAAGVPLWMDFW
jgi:hypothetical protein